MCERTYVLYSCNHTGRYLGRSGCDCPELVGYHCVGRNCARCARAWREIGQLQNEGPKVGTDEDEDEEGKKDDESEENGENDEEEDDWDFSGDIDVDDHDDYGYEDDHDDEDQEGNEEGVEEADGDEEQELQDDSDSTNSAITVLRSGKPIKSRAKILTREKKPLQESPTYKF